MAGESISQSLQTAVQHHQAGRLPQAEALYRQILQQQPRHSDALHLLGVLAHQCGQQEAALGLIQQSLAVAPTFAPAYKNLGAVYRALGRPDEAMEACRKALALWPDFADAYNTLGNALRDKWQIDEAIAAFRKAIQLQPKGPEPYNNLGSILYETGHYEEALAAYDQALRLRPNYPDPHWNKSVVLLLQGRLKKGWPEFEWRWQCPAFAQFKRNFPQPPWNGQNLAGKTILLHGEQGLGDAIQFVRYVPLLASGQARVVVACQKELQSLLGTVSGVAQVLADTDQPPDCDFHSPLLSLPLGFDTTLQTIPAEVPYVHADAARVEAWRQRLAADAGGAKLKVGLAWAGSPRHANDRRRSLALSALAPLAQVEQVSFYSLQKQRPADPDPNSPGPLQLTDFTSELDDFAQTAALIENLDLVICVDTAVAHLAGSLGKPTWVLLPFVPDWRWLLEREDSPWYPTMRLFRQPAPGRWDQVVERVAGELCKERQGDKETR